MRLFIGVVTPSRALRWWSVDHDRAEGEIAGDGAEQDDMTNSRREQADRRRGSEGLWSRK